jgi:two-component system chemotaxis response regulator CheB
MTATKVLVVDDSITMRALFTNALESDKNIVVVGAADGAEDARGMIKSLRPDVITLDIEMPGMNGIEFLKEIMSTEPLPVVMLSTLTQKGAEVSLMALELGAVDCFPKPTRTSMDEFEAISGKLRKIVLTAAKSNLEARVKPAAKPAADANQPKPYRWDGSLVAIVGGMGAIEAAQEMLATYPANCPPTILLLDVDEGLGIPFASRLAKTVAPEVKVAADGAELLPGTIYVAADPSRHVVVDRWPNGAMRFLDRDPVNGHRPSADLLFASVAKTAGAKATAVILSGGGQDGAAGLGAIASVKGLPLTQDSATALVSERIKAALTKVPAAKAAPAAALGRYSIRAGDETAAAA